MKLIKNCGIIKGKLNALLYQEYEYIGSNLYGNCSTSLLLYIGDKDYFIYYPKKEYKLCKGKNIIISPEVKGSKCKVLITPGINIYK